MRITRSGDSRANDNDWNDYSLTTLNALLRFDTIPERGQKGRKGIMMKVAAREKRLPAEIRRTDTKSEPSAIESEIHPSHKPPVYALCISRLRRVKIPDPDSLAAGPERIRAERKRIQCQDIHLSSRQSFVIFTDGLTISAVPKDRSIFISFTPLQSRSSGAFCPDRIGMTS